MEAGHSPPFDEERGRRRGGREERKVDRVETLGGTGTGAEVRGVRLRDCATGITACPWSPGSGVVGMAGRVRRGRRRTGPGPGHRSASPSSACVASVSPGPTGVPRRRGVGGPRV